MKQLLKSVFCSLLLLSVSTAILGRRHCDNDCNFDCNVGCNTNCNNNFNNNCNNNNCGDWNRDCNSGCLDRNAQVRTFVLSRDQTANSMMELVGWQHAIQLPDMCNFYGAFYLGFEYQRTFRPCRLAESFLGAPCLSFQGSSVANRSENAIVADYLGLNPDFNQTLCFRPRIQNFNVNLGLFFGLDNWYQGGFFRIFTTLNHTKWDLFDYDDDCCFSNCCPVTPTTAVAPIDPCFGFGGGDANTLPVNTLQEALGTSNNACRSCPGVTAAATAPQTGCGALISFCDHDRTRLSGIMFDLGWNFYNDPCYHLGAFLRYEAPTGNTPCGNYLFEPISGNGHHHAFGAGITAHANLWDNQQYQSLAFWFEGNVVHLFKDCQCRTFDLCENGAYSRYLALREFEADGVTPTGRLLQAGCLTRHKVDVKIDARVDATFKFAYQCCNWGVDLGYNVYYQSHEDIDCSRRGRHDDRNCRSLCPQNANRYGVAGLTGSCCYGYTITSTGLGGTCLVTDEADTPTPIALTTPNVSVFDVDAALVPAADVALPDLGTETVCLAYNSTQPVASPTPGVGTPCTLLTAENGYRPIVANGAPVLLTEQSINYRSGLAPEILTHKIFTHINYIWADECGYNPFLGIGAEVEFSGNNHNDHHRRCDRDSRLDLNQWGVWIKGGMSF